MGMTGWWRHGRLLALCLALGVVAQPAEAHDFWIEPTAFRVSVGQAVGVGLRVGDHFEGQPIPRNPSRIVKFVSVGRGLEQEIVGRAGADPAGVVRFDSPGLRILAYRGNHAFTTLDATRFEKHLEEKGLDRIRALRGDPDGAKESETKVREAYSRCAKALVLVGGGSGDDAGAGANNGGSADRALGFTLEIVSESNPYSMEAGDELRFRLLFDRDPLPGVLVTARRRKDGVRALSSRTDAEGRVTLTLDPPGVWLIAAVHMAEAPENLDADYESWWASMTFELPARPPAGASL